MSEHGPFANINVVFRTDASLDIGSGHVMRCLTLADELTRAGATCTFICRDHIGNLGPVVIERGYNVHLLSRVDVGYPNSNGTAHALWLGADQRADAAETLAVLHGTHVHWLVVDHYGIDESWEKVLRPRVDRIFVIDDLADRIHDCDVLLDQNLGAKHLAYQGLVPAGCTCLFGPGHALLAPMFGSMRQQSIVGRASRPLTRLLVTMGGVDKDDVTSWVLHGLKECSAPSDLRITVVMGRTAPWIERVREVAKEMPWPTDVLVDVKDMASLMSEMDLAIGAAGSTSWERCCVGLPTVLMVLAANQLPIAKALLAEHAVELVDHGEQYASRNFRGAVEYLLATPSAIKEMANSAARITDGSGAVRVREVLYGLSGQYGPTPAQ